ncbi:metallophosphoesterase family protein [Robertmurraya massiliosenegalensis]|uniref:hypothetical protein n=1 Tax=Robertmurraya massiliosenegalensis TaxID=1287657 RepID=UPI00031D0198|nr:hypothetical protein [Robertmurraya massiliosenegalensis]
MKLPKLLAGPIIRRVEPTKAYIWVAMSDAFEIIADLYEIKHTSFQYEYKYEPVSIYTKVNSMKLGNNLYIYLIELSPRMGLFPQQQLFGYNLHFTCPDETFDLGSLGLLSSKNEFSITYHHVKYPTFFLTNQDKNILFGSCRKLHGKGKDALESGDMKLKETYFDKMNRPSSLFLIGDQIYADDVADPIMPFISDVALELTNDQENVTNIDERLKNEHFKKALNQVHGRQFIIENFCKFTSSKGHNHLLTFGEFAAMYLLSFSPELWQVANEEHLIPSFDELVNKEKYYFIYPKENGYEGEHAREFLEQKRQYDRHLEELIRFQQALPKIRRLLANIPTYMIFDDHDITDDWNISLEWSENVKHANLGKHVIANGLTAFFAFQGWGNDPKQFDHRFTYHIEQYLNTLHPHSVTYRYWIETVLKFDKWSFVAPTNPLALFLDTRTKRSYDLTPKPVQPLKASKEITTGPRLINDEGWDILSQQLHKSGWKSNSPLILVSPVPFYGIRLLERLLYRFVMPLKSWRLPVQTAFDLELWRFNGKGFYEFHRRIAQWNPNHCVILSGDTHIASALKTKVHFEDEQTRYVHQLTSSPLKNESFSTLSKFLLQRILKGYHLLKGKNELQRSCDSTFNLLYHQKNSTKGKSYLWKEFIQPYTLSNNTIVEMDSNLGYLSLEDDRLELKLLQNKRMDRKDKTFK